MIRRTRMYAAGLAVSIAAGLGATVAAPALAAPTTVTFNCTETVPSVLPGVLPPTVVPLGGIGVPIDLSVLSSTTVPLGGTLKPVTGTLGLAPVMGAVSGLLTRVTGLTSNLVAQIGSTPELLGLDSAGNLTVPGGLTLPSTPSSLPVTLAQGSSFGFGLLGGVLGSVSCVLPQVSGQLANVLVEGKPSPGGSGTINAGLISWGGAGGTGPTGSTGTLGGSGASGAANLCLQPLARASRSAKVTARAARRSAPSRVAQRVVVRVAKRARGTVVACYGSLPIASTSVKHGRAVLRLPRFYPGHYRVSVRYLGGAGFRGASSKVRLTVS